MRKVLCIKVKMHTVDPRAFVRRDHGRFGEVQLALHSPMETQVNTLLNSYLVESGSQILRTHLHCIRETTGKV